MEVWVGCASRVQVQAKVVGTTFKASSTRNKCPDPGKNVGVPPSPPRRRACEGAANDRAQHKAPNGGRLLEWRLTEQELMAVHHGCGVEMEVGEEVVSRKVWSGRGGRRLK